MIFDLLQCSKDGVVHLNVVFRFKFGCLWIPISPLIKCIAVLDWDDQHLNECQGWCPYNGTDQCNQWLWHWSSKWFWIEGWHLGPLAKVECFACWFNDWVCEMNLRILGNCETLLEVEEDEYLPSSEQWHEDMTHRWSMWIPCLGCELDILLGFQ
jgi:hypothetical protein